jgi:hypothetical protein
VRVVLDTNILVNANPSVLFACLATSARPRIEQQLARSQPSVFDREPAGALDQLLISACRPLLETLPHF